MVIGSSSHVAGGILAVFTIGATACVPARSPESARQPPELRLEGVRFRVFRGETLRADGTAALLSYQRESAEVAGTGLELRLIRGEQPVVVSAPTGGGSLATRTFHAEGGIRLARGDDSATTESARFDPNQGSQGLILGDRPVELQGRGYTLRGRGFTLDPAAGTVTVRDGATLVAGLPGGR